MKTYAVRKIEPEKMKINGRIDHVNWNMADRLVDFYSPWNTKPIEKTEFRALWDGAYLYFGFTVYEKDVFTDVIKHGDEAINHSDRVELFFRTDANMNPYYCLEMDTTCRVMDFKALPGKQFDFDWSWPKDGLELKSFRDEDKYQVEGRISIQSLEELNLIDGNKIQTGVYRANYLKTPDGQRDPQWICWVDPKTEEPNFHIPGSFGTFVLEQRPKSKQ